MLKRGWLRLDTPDESTKQGDRYAMRAIQTPALMAGVVATLLGASWLLTYLPGGAGVVPPHWFYLPILLAASRFGFVGAIMVALASGILAGPLMPLDVDTGQAQRLSDWGTRTLFFVGMGLVMSVLIAWRRRTEKQLARNLGLLETLYQQREKLLGRLLSTEEQERKKFAFDLHDDAVQVLTAIGLRLDLLTGKLTEPERIEELRQVRQTLRQCVARLRHLLFDLHPPELEEDGLVKALRRYLDGVKSQGRIDYRLDAHLPREPEEEIKGLTYRICQGALTNVAKHAQASVVEVLLDHSHGGVLGRVTDDGRGLPAGALDDHPGHLGIRAMRERAELVGGWCRVRSGPGGGTVVEFWIPESLSPPEAAPGTSLSQVAS